MRHTESLDKLFDSILSLKTREECYDFFEDACTIKEITEIAQRLEVATLLSEGKSYVAITEEIGISSATIGRVNRCLKYGNGGYKMVLDRLGEEK
ncbi:MAG: YerC/YecD family TrpR-related protein [Oscillospiraceae bacterium]|nr:YerC/YecD family TrpR-related protein [Oscillospiraceae bacterium]